jgi:hypothetical protein
MKYRKPTYRLRWQKLLLGCLLFLLGGGSLAAQGISYRAQSLYLYKFTRYVTWPQPVMEKDTLFIGVYGRSPNVTELRLIGAVKRAAGNRPIAIRPVGGLSELQAMLESKTFGLQILYVASSKSRQLSGILEALGEKPVLVVAERGGLARKGASINFMVTEDDILRFEYNPNRLSRLELNVQPDLLRLGFPVR